MTSTRYNKLTKILFFFFIILHLFLLNINSAEWGDSYRILRASEYVQNFTYPSDEKRPPLFSILLAFRPQSIEAVFWARIIMLFLSICFFKVFQLLLDKFTKDNDVKVLSLLLFSLNPVFLYWSIRVMADLFFALLVYIAFLLYEGYRDKKDFNKLIFLGLVVGLSILTRFEGYLLFGAMLVGLIFVDPPSRFYKSFSLSNVFTSLVVNVKQVFAYLLSVMLLVIPYIFYKNPFGSSYFDEPGGRTYDLNTGAIYILSFLFSFGFMYFGYFLLLGVFISSKAKFFLKRCYVVVFMLLELLLILLWPAAIPRLFVPIIPLCTFLMSRGMISYWLGDHHLRLSLKSKSVRSFFTSYKVFITLNLFLLGVYMVGQYIYRLQFLVLIKPLFVFVVFLSFYQLYLLVQREKVLFMSSLLLTLFLWAFSTIWIHRNAYATIKEVSVYTAENMYGIVAFNDYNSVSDWYLDYFIYPDVINDEYLAVRTADDLNKKKLQEWGVDYIILTSEPDKGFGVSVSDKLYLEEIFGVTEEINGHEFYTKLLKVHNAKTN